MTRAVHSARGAVPARPRGRDSHYYGAQRIGHGVGYAYPHDDERGWVEQDYMPEGLAGTRYYEPSERGREAEVAERLLDRRRGDSA